MDYWEDDEEVYQYAEEAGEEAESNSYDDENDYEDVEEDRAAKKARNDESLAEKKAKMEQKMALAAALVQAARTGAFEQMKLLISQGADINEKICGCTALMYAAFYGRDEMVKYLVELKAELNAQNFNGITALSWAAEREHHTTVELLLSHGSSANIPDGKGLTALHKAAKAGKLLLFKLLVEVGQADVNMESTQEHYTPLQEAAYFGQMPVVEYLLQYTDVDVDYQNAEGKTALHRAVYKNQREIVQCLINFGCNVNLQDCNGRTPLHWAAFFGHPEIFALLYQNGAKLDILDNLNLTAEDIAKSKGKTDILQIIQNDKEAASPVLGDYFVHVTTVEGLSDLDEGSLRGSVGEIEADEYSLSQVSSAYQRKNRSESAVLDSIANQKLLLGKRERKQRKKL